MADLQDRRSLDLLTGLLESSEQGRTRSECYVALRKLTSHEFKYQAFAGPEQRVAQLAGWKQWLSENRDTVELQVPLSSVRLSASFLNGNQLLALGYKQKVIELDPEGKEVWSYECQGPWSAEKMANGNYLVAEYNSNRVTEVDGDGDIVREVKVNGPLNARPLDNGNWLVSSYSDQTVIEFDAEGEEVWKYKGSSMVADAVRTEDGLTLVSEYQRATLVDERGDVVWEIKPGDVDPNLNQIMGVQALANGNFLLCSMNNLVIEVDREKNEIWRYTANRPSDAFRTEEGTTLVTEAARMIEVDQEGNVIWEREGNNYGSMRK